MRKLCYLVALFMATAFFPAIGQDTTAIVTTLKQDSSILVAPTGDFPTLARRYTPNPFLVHTKTDLLPPLTDSIPVVLIPEPEGKKFKNVLGEALLAESMILLVSTPAFAKNGAYWSAASYHVMSLGAFNGGKTSENNLTRLVTFGLLNAFAAHHYFVKPTSGAPVFWRNVVGLNAVAFTSLLVDKTISHKKKRSLSKT